MIGQSHGLEEIFAVFKEFEESKEVLDFEKGIL